MTQTINFWTLLTLTQEHISEQYAAALTDKEKLSQLKAYIEKYLRDMNYTLQNYSQNELVNKIFCEMAECATRS
jgi:pilus assembly protein CpaF